VFEYGRLRDVRVGLNAIYVFLSHFSLSLDKSERHPIQLRDANGRLLTLHVTLSVERTGAVLMTVWAPYWIVNKSGVPLIIRQEACQEDAAGQLEEHEHAKDLNPLMFSFADNVPEQ
jgi:hypothetical protein